MSSKTGMGIDDLLETVAAGRWSSKAPGGCHPRNRSAQLDKGRTGGPPGQRWRRRCGAGKTYGRVRAMLDENGRSNPAGPSIPVEIKGSLGRVHGGPMGARPRTPRPALGKFQQHQAGQAASAAGNMFADMTAGDVKTLPIIIKADVQGSQEALSSSLLKLSTDEVKVQVVYAGVGGISESTSTWRSRPRRSSSVSTPVPTPCASWPKAMVSIFATTTSFYDAVDELKAAMSGMLTPEKKEEVIGMAEIRTVFVASKIGTVAGCMVTSGMVSQQRISDCCATTW